MTLESPTDTGLYRSRLNPKINRNFEVFTPTDVLAAITQHIPDKGAQMVRCYGWYSNKKRGQRHRGPPVGCAPVWPRPADFGPESLRRLVKRPPPTSPRPNTLAGRRQRHIIMANERVAKAILRKPWSVKKANPYQLLSTNDVMSPLTNWPGIATKIFAADGNFTNSIPMNPDDPAEILQHSAM